MGTSSPTINETANPVQVPGFTSSPLLKVSADLLYSMNNIFRLSASSGTSVFFSSTLEASPTSSNGATSTLGVNSLDF